MAMYHLHVRFVQRSAGRSSVAAAAYRAGEKLMDERKGEAFDFRHKTHVEHSEVLLPDHVPPALADRGTLWNTVETGLKRKDAQPAFEVEVALPRELSHDQRVNLVRDFARQQFVAKGLAVDLCIHVGQASDGGEHPHAHMLITTRRWNADGTMAKAARDMQDNPKLLQKVYALEQQGEIEQSMLLSKGTNLAGWREAWADYSNDFLAQSGHDARVDHRTLAAQKIARSPLPYIGAAFHQEMDALRGWLAQRVDAFKEAARFKSLRQQFDSLREKRRDLSAEFIAHAQEHARELVEGLMPREQERGQEIER